MSNSSKVSVRFGDELAIALRTKCMQIGMSDSELIRLAVASFLAKEDALTEYLSALEIIEKKIAIMAARQEQYAKAIGSAIFIKEADRTDEIKQKFVGRLTQITEQSN